MTYVIGLIIGIVVGGLLVFSIRHSSFSTKSQNLQPLTHDLSHTTVGLIDAMLGGLLWVAH